MQLCLAISGIDVTRLLHIDLYTHMHYVRSGSKCMSQYPGLGVVGEGVAPPIGRFGNIGSCRVVGDGGNCVGEVRYSHY